MKRPGLLPHLFAATLFHGGFWFAGTLAAQEEAMGGGPASAR